MTDLIERTENGTGEYDELRWLTDSYGQYQKLRIALGNRIFASAEGLDTNEPSAYMLRSFERLEALEKDTFLAMKAAVKHHPAWPWLDGVRGMGPTISTKILGLISDISKFETVSNLWSFAGYGLKDGKRQVPVRGEKLTYNRRLKTAVYLAGDSFIKSRSPYRSLYDEAKAKYRERKQIQPLLEVRDLKRDGIPEVSSVPWKALIKQINSQEGNGTKEVVWSDGHVDNAARRVMVKIFLSHLWEVWRREEGLPVRRPYVFEYLNHVHYDNPYDFSEGR